MLMQTGSNAFRMRLNPKPERVRMEIGLHVATKDPNKPGPFSAGWHLLRMLPLIPAR